MSTHIYASFADVPNFAVGTICACPTDTVYGLSCRVDDAGAVQKIREIKGKGKDMPVIVLIGSLAQLDMFVDTKAASFAAVSERLLSKLWPGSVSIVFSHVLPEWKHISPDGSIAVRFPSRKDLQEFLITHGPLVSTSANPHGKTPATTAGEVKAYFPNELDCVVDTGVCNNPPSTIVKILR